MDGEINNRPSDGRSGIRFYLMLLQGTAVFIVNYLSSLVQYLKYANSNYLLKAWLKKETRPCGSIRRPSQTESITAWNENETKSSHWKSDTSAINHRVAVYLLSPIVPCNKHQLSIVIETSLWAATAAGQYSTKSFRKRGLRQRPASHWYEPVQIACSKREVRPLLCKWKGRKFRWRNYCFAKHLFVSSKQKSNISEITWSKN